MKNMKVSGAFHVVSGIVLFSVIAVAWYALSYALSLVVPDNELWVDIAAAVMVASVVRYILTMLLADDQRTFTFSGFLAGASGILIIAMFVAVTTYHANGNDLSQVPELIAWTVPSMLAIPVIIGYCFFSVRAFNRYWGEDKKPMVSGSNSGVVIFGERWLDRIGTIAALAASGIGTYALVYAATQNNWIALFYVGTIELAIYWFMQLNERTYDRTVFWSAYAVASIAFLAAFLIQLGNASHIINAGTRVAEIGKIMSTYWFLPPALFATLGIVLYIHNQTKVPELFGSDKGRIQTGRPDARLDTFRRQTAQPNAPRSGNTQGQGIPPGLLQHLLSIGYTDNDLKGKSVIELRAMAQAGKAGVKKEKNESNPKRPNISESDFRMLREAGLSPQQILALPPAALQAALERAKSDPSPLNGTRSYASQPKIVITTDDDDDDDEDDDTNP